MSYVFADPKIGNCSTLVTHIDDPYKLKHLKGLIEDNNKMILVCMSNHGANFLKINGIPSSNLRVLLPAIDNFIQPRRIVIATSGRIYADGRKNENWLLTVAEKLELGNFEFRFFGDGWEKISTKLENAGAICKLFVSKNDFASDHYEINESYSTIDYWMYLGFDEGSMGCLDAAFSGVPLITTPQGFHLDFPNGIEYPVTSPTELIAVLEKLEQKRRHILNSINNWSWRNYAINYIDIWIKESMVEPDLIFLDSPINNEKSIAYGFSRKHRLSLRRIRSALLRTKIALKFRK